MCWRLKNVLCIHVPATWNCLYRSFTAHAINWNSEPIPKFQGVRYIEVFLCKKIYNFSLNKCFLYFGMSAMDLLPYTVLSGKKYFGVLESKNRVNLYPTRYCPNSKRIWNQIRNIRKKLEVIPN